MLIDISIIPEDTSEELVVVSGETTPPNIGFHLSNLLTQFAGMSYEVRIKVTDLQEKEAA